MRARIVLLLALAIDLVPAIARADDHSIAEALFQAGKTLMAEGKYAEACPKLTESQRVEPGGGTLLLLGVCHQKEGKYATAYAELRSAQAIAHRDRRADREKLAARHLAEVEPRVSKLVIRTPDREVSLVIDGVPISEAGAGVPLPVDPGAHTLEVTARGRRPHKTGFTIGTTAETRTVDVPALEIEPEPPPAPIEPAPPPPKPEPPPQPPSSAGSTQRLAGFAIGAAGLVAIGAGVFFGVRALDANTAAKALCDPDRCTSAEGLAKNDDARSSATIANVAIAVGAVAVVAGVVLVLLAPKSARAPQAALAF